MISRNEDNLGKVYLVDDDRDFLASLVFLLSKADLNCVPFYSAADFLASAFEVGPACLIIDQAMPLMSGIELFRELNLRNYKKPIAFLTAVGTVPSAVEAIKLGAAEFLEKPIEPSELIARVKEYLESDRLAMIRSSAVEEFEKKFKTLTARQLEIAMLVREGILSHRSHLV